jgi:hypothetical protein
MMKNKILLIVLAMTLLAVTTVACSGATEAEDVALAEVEAEDVAMAESQGGGIAGEKSSLNTLMMGVLLLENDDMAVTVEQADEMLPLWKMARSLNENSNVAIEELDALAEQISESLTDEQLVAIKEVETSDESLRELMQELGVGFGGGQGGDGSSEGFQRPGGGMPGSGAGGGPGGGAGGTGLTPEQIATMQAEREGFSRSGMNPGLLEALIELLEDKTGA